MKLRYVGDLPKVTSRGVGFDQTKPDKYTFMNAAVELLEALSYGATETTQHLHNLSGVYYSDEDLLALLKKHCSDLNAILTERDIKSDAFKEDLIKRVAENSIISEDERNAWRTNIAYMEEYYRQYVTNESAYRCALDALAEAIKGAKVKEIIFPMFKNYGAVLHDLTAVLAKLKSPIDATLSVEAKNDAFEGKFTIQHR
ncbi:MAG: hypothetical protein PF439_02530 [Helicobacteraceae bacterium]|jgi:hypothetical protein|nr:hypothetical protein [Helicobacteraceae bacterium]